MRLLSCIVVVVALVRAAHADPHSEMAEALAAQADLHPGPAALPTRGWTAHAPSAPHGTTGANRTPTQLGARSAADQAAQQAQAQGLQSSVARQAQAAAQAAAGQAQSQAAKDRAAAHPHPGH